MTDDGDVLLAADLGEARVADEGLEDDGGVSAG